VIGVLLFTALLAQAPGDDVANLVRQGSFVEALQVAEGVSGAEGAFLVTWTRHQAGDLTGALDSVRAGLVDHPDDERLLEQGAWLATSLLLGEEATGYAERLSAVGHSSSSDLLGEAAVVLDAASEVKDSTRRAWWVLVIAGAALCVLGVYGSSGDAGVRGTS